MPPFLVQIELVLVLVFVLLLVLVLLLARLPRAKEHNSACEWVVEQEYE